MAMGCIFQTLAFKALAATIRLTTQSAFRSGLSCLWRAKHTIHRTGPWRNTKSTRWCGARLKMMSGLLSTCPARRRTWRWTSVRLEAVHAVEKGMPGSLPRLKPLKKNIKPNTLRVDDMFHQSLSERTCVKREAAETPGVNWEICQVALPSWSEPRSGDGCGVLYRSMAWSFWSTTSGSRAYVWKHVSWVHCFYLGLAGSMLQQLPLGHGLEDSAGHAKARAAAQHHLLCRGHQRVRRRWETASASGDVGSSAADLIWSLWTFRSTWSILGALGFLMFLERIYCYTVIPDPGRPMLDFSGGKSYCRLRNLPSCSSTSMNLMLLDIAFSCFFIFFSVFKAITEVEFWSQTVDNLNMPVKVNLIYLWFKIFSANLYIYISRYPLIWYINDYTRTGHVCIDVSTGSGWTSSQATIVKLPGPQNGGFQATHQAPNVFVIRICIYIHWTITMNYYSD